MSERQAFDPLRSLRARTSIRRFSPEPVSPELLDRILAAAVRAPTSSNLQAYSLILVEDQVLRARLAALAGNQRHVEAAPVFGVICGDLHRIAAAAQHHALGLRLGLDALVRALIDATVFGTALSLAAEACGLGTVMIGGIRNDISAVASLLELPLGVVPVFGLCIGHPAEQPVAQPRLDPGLLIHRDRYSPQDPCPQMCAYDEQIRAHRQGLGLASEVPWSRHVVELVASLRDRDLRERLEERGIVIVGAD